MPPKRLKVGVIGTGIGAKHLEAYADHPRADLLAVCDLNQTALQTAAHSFSVPQAFVDYRQMLALKELEAVSVCVPNYLHAPLVIAALQAGKHVLVEKPLATTAREGRRMLEVAEQAGNTFMIQFNNRYRPEAQLLQDAVEGGELGEIYFARCGWIRRNGIPGWGSWFTRQQSAGGGPLIDLAVHMLDLTWWLMGRPRPVTCLGATYQKFGHKGEGLGPWGTPDPKGKFDVEDMAVGMLRFENGATLLLEASWAGRIEREFVYSTLCGDAAGATLERVWDVDGEDATSHDRLLLFKQQGPVPADVNLKIQPDPTMGRHAAVRHFVDCCLSGREPISPAADGLAIMQILEALYKSARTGKAVNLKP